MDALFDPRAFALGMVALLNPCGFALLPAYLGFFLGSDDDHEPSTMLALSRAQRVGLAMSAGFLAVFGILGLFLAGTLTALNSSGVLPIITAIIGVGLVILGFAMLGGFQLNVRLPKLSKGGDARTMGSMFLFGVSYAVASLTCTIGIFLLAVGTSASGASFAERFGNFISYAIGMGLLATFLTLAVGFGKTGIVNRFRQVLPMINVISGAILVIVGAYVAIYGIWSNQVLTGGDVIGWMDSIVLTVEGWQGSLANWFDTDVTIFGLLDQPRRRTTILGWLFITVNAMVAVGGFAARRNALRRFGSEVDPGLA